MRAPGLVGVSLALALSWSAAASAQTRDACAAAYTSGQEARRDGRLLAARDAFAVCRQPSCAAFMQTDCVAWSESIASEIPALLFSVLGVAPGEGAPIVAVDGAAVRTTGPLEVDPGPHVVRATLGARTIEKPLRVAPGGGKFVVELRLPPASGPVAPPPDTNAQVGADVAPSPPPRGLPLGTEVLGAVGVVSLGAYGFFGVRGLHRRGALGSCTPDCSLDDVHDAKRDLDVASVFLGVGLAAVAGSVAFYVFRAPPADAAVSLVRTDDVTVALDASGLRGTFR